MHFTGQNFQHVGGSYNPNMTGGQPQVQAHPSLMLAPPPQPQPTLHQPSGLTMPAAPSWTPSLQPQMYAQYYPHQQAPRYQQYHPHYPHVQHQHMAHMPPVFPSPHHSLLSHLPSPMPTHLEHQHQQQQHLQSIQQQQQQQQQQHSNQSLATIEAQPTIPTQPPPPQPPVLLPPPQHLPPPPAWLAQTQEDLSRLQAEHAGGNFRNIELHTLAPSFENNAKEEGHDGFDEEGVVFALDGHSEWLTAKQQYDLQVQAQAGAAAASGSADAASSSLRNSTSRPPTMSIPYSWDLLRQQVMKTEEGTASADTSADAPDSHKFVFVATPAATADKTTTWHGMSQNELAGELQMNFHPVALPDQSSSINTGGADGAFGSSSVPGSDSSNNNHTRQKRRVVKLKNTTTYRKCDRINCGRAAKGSTSLCIAHGGGLRCANATCNKSARRPTLFCIRHGGGRRCQVPGCTSGAEGATPCCKRHGGGRRCTVDGCAKSARGGSHRCIAHGGGRRCNTPLCPRAAVGATLFCVGHGGGTRCEVETCRKSVQASTAFCKSHRKCMIGCDRDTVGVHGMCQVHADEHAAGVLGA